MTMIDADAHVIESDRTWEFMDEEHLQYKPQALINPDPAIKQREFWRIDGRLRPKREGPGNFLEGSGTTHETREASDIAARLRHMDELGVDIHVLYPTVFLAPLPENPDIEWALTKAYNRWMADIWS